MSSPRDLETPRCDEFALEIYNQSQAKGLGDTNRGINIGEAYSKTLDFARQLERELRQARGRTFTRREERYFNRLVARADLLRERLHTTELTYKDEIEAELHALDWVVAELCDRLPSPPEEK